MVLAAHGDSFAAKRMRKLTQRRAVDYTSTVVRYMQVMFVMENHPHIFGLYLKFLSHLSYTWHIFVVEIFTFCMNSSVDTCIIFSVNGMS